MTDTTYNGWTNYETWNCKLWIDNDGWLGYWEERAYKIGAKDQLLEIVNGLCTLLSQDNPRFDRARFLEACGL